LQPLGAAAAVVQVTDINDGRYSHIYQSAMSLLVIDFTYLEGQDNELVVKEVAAVDSNCNRVSSYVFNRPCGWEEVPMFNARMNQAIDNGCNWNDGDVPYAELETVLHREASSLLQSIASDFRRQNLLAVIDHTVIDMTQLGCSQLADINLPAISCAFACHNKSKHFCSLRTAYALAQWLIFYTLSMQYANCPPQPAYH